MSRDLHLERRGLVLGAVAFGACGAAQAQSAAKVLEDLARAAVANRSSGTSQSTVGSILSGLPRGVSSTEAEGGLREALTNGAIAAALRLGKVDGYWADGKVRVPLPSPLDTMQSRLKPLRLSVPLDNFQLKLNRAAELAAPQAQSIFTSVIRSLSIGDVVQVLRGGDTAGTELLKSKATPELVTLFTPPMSDAVDRSGAGPALDRINARYGAQIGNWSGLANYPTTLNLGPNVSAPASTLPKSAKSAAVAAAPQQNVSLKNQLIGFAVTKALDGLFLYVGEEERLIRRDPVKRSTDLLKRVFGGL